MGSDCGCQEAITSNAKSRHALRGNAGLRTGVRGRSLPMPGDSSGMNAIGSVLDNTTGIAGIVKEVHPRNSPSRIIVEAVSPDGVIVRATLEGYTGLFNGVQGEQFVFCAVKPQQLLGHAEIRGVCWWILNFPTADGIVKGISNLIFTESNDSRNTKAPTPSTEKCVKCIAADLAAKLHHGSVVCIIAAIKAASDSKVQCRFDQLVDEGFYPIGFECCAGSVDSVYSGYMLVVFRFRNSYGVRRAFVVPVKLSTLAACDRWSSEIGDINEVDPGSFECVRDAFSANACVDVTVRDGKACLNVPYAGSVRISVPGVPNGTVAEACIDTCKRFGVVCGVEVTVYALGQEVASKSWGCC